MIDPNLRRLGIGASEVGALYGVDERRDAFSVWLSKKGDNAGFVAEPNIRMMVGKALEQGILQLYSFVTGRAADWHDQTHVHPARPWMVYTPDAFVRGEKRGVDCKVVFWDQRRKWGATARDIPERIQLQCAYYMAALEYDAWDVAALVGEGEPRIYTLYRDAEMERSMLAYVEEWHRRYIAGDQQPPIGGSDDARYWLGRTFPDHKRPDIREATDQEIAWLTEYAEVRLAQKGIEARRGELENAIKLAIANREGIAWAGGKFTWRRTKDRKEVKWEDLAFALLGFHVKDQKDQEDLIQAYTGVKPGYRKIWFDSDLLHDEAAA